MGGCRKKISECPKTLFERNLDDVLSATMHCIEFNPKVVFCVAKPPIEAFVPLISEVNHYLSIIIITEKIQGYYTKKSSTEKISGNLDEAIKMSQFDSS